MVVAIIIYNFTYFSPFWNLLLDGALLVLLAIGLGTVTSILLQYRIIETSCAREIWGSERSASACRDYKAFLVNGHSSNVTFPFSLSLIPVYVAIGIAHGI